MTKTQQGARLIALGILGAVCTLIVRGLAVDDHSFERTVESFNDGPYLVAGGVCALLVLCGVILYATGRD